MQTTYKRMLNRSKQNTLKENKMAKLTKLAKVNESITLNRYDNGYMVEVGGRDDDSEWKTAKILCNTEEEMLEVVKEWTTMDIDN